MRVLRILAAGLLGAGALVGILVALIILPMIAVAQIEWHTQVPVWISAPNALLRFGFWPVYSLLLPAATLAGALIVALLPVVGPRARRLATGITYSVTFGACAVAIYLLLAAAAGMIFVNDDLFYKNKIYASVLDQFSLRESADGKFDQVQAFVAHTGSMRMVEVKSAASLSLQQRHEQIRDLLYGIKASKDVPFLKQVLATTDMFKADIIKDSFDPKQILEAAALCGAPSDNIEAFYAWLEPKIGTDGWNPIPLHVAVFDQ